MRKARKPTNRRICSELRRLGKQHTSVGSTRCPSPPFSLLVSGGASHSFAALKPVDRKGKRAHTESPADPATSLSLALALSLSPKEGRGSSTAAIEVKPESRANRALLIPGATKYRARRGRGAPILGRTQPARTCRLRRARMRRPRDARGTRPAPKRPSEQPPSRRGRYIHYVTD